jgi:hypothetical protein
VGAIFGDFKITAYFNNQPYHGPPLALNMVHNAILKNYKGDDYGIKIINHPLPYQGVDKVRVANRAYITVHVLQTACRLCRIRGFNEFVLTSFRFRWFDTAADASAETLLSI